MVFCSTLVNQISYGRIYRNMAYYSISAKHINHGRIFWNMVHYWSSVRRKHSRLNIPECGKFDHWKVEGPWLKKISHGWIWQKNLVKVEYTWVRKESVKSFVIKWRKYQTNFVSIIDPPCWISVPLKFQFLWFHLCWFYLIFKVYYSSTFVIDLNIKIRFLRSDMGKQISCK